MEHRRIGKSAIYVSDICMGTMTFGSQTDEAEAHRILDRCLDAGINFFDTAEGYPVPPDIKWVGRTEDIVGRWMKGKNRDAIIMATKVSGPSHKWFKSPKRGGMTTLDRHNIITAVEESLRRLQTDYIDLYQTHWPDHGLAYDETMEVLDELVRSGKVRVLGCSNETSYGLMKSLATSERLGVARYESIQNNFSINNRRFEDELKQVCRQEGISLLPYSPLGGGVLSGKYLDGARPEGARFPAIWKCQARAKSTWRSVLRDHARFKARCGLSLLRKKRACHQSRWRPLGRNSMTLSHPPWSASAKKINSTTSSPRLT